MRIQQRALDVIGCSLNFEHTGVQNAVHLMQFKILRLTARNIKRLQTKIDLF